MKLKKNNKKIMYIEKICTPLYKKASHFDDSSKPQWNLKDVLFLTNYSYTSLLQQDILYNF